MSCHLFYPLNLHYDHLTTSKKQGLLCLRKSKQYFRIESGVKNLKLSNACEYEGKDMKRSVTTAVEDNDPEKRKRVPNDEEEKKPIRGGHWAFSIDNLLSHTLEKNFKL